ncbi:MAG: hypothetical protein AABY11_02840 [archaeon]
MTPPLGPFFRGEKIILPLQEAREAHENGLGKIDCPPTQTKWYCRNQKNTLQELRDTLKERYRLHDTRKQVALQPYVSQYQLAYTLHEWKSPEIALREKGTHLLHEWEASLPLHLQNNPTRWRSGEWAHALENSAE